MASTVGPLLNVTTSVSAGTLARVDSNAAASARASVALPVIFSASARA